MENQINVENQNTQQVGQNPVNQPVLAPEKPKTNYLMIGGIILACFVVFGFGGYYFGNQPNITQDTGTNSCQSPTGTPITSTQPTNPIIKSTLQYEIDLPENWETGYEMDKETSRLIISYDDPRFTNMAFYRSHKPKTNKADKDVHIGYGSLYDLSLVEVLFAVAKLEDKYQTWQDVLNEENNLYEYEQNRLKSKGLDPCDGPVEHSISLKPQSISIGDYIALNHAYYTYCEWESPVPSEYHGFWMIFPSSSSKEYVYIRYVYSQNNQTASESVKQLESAIKSIKIIGNKN